MLLAPTRQLHMAAPDPRRWSMLKKCVAGDGRWKKNYLGLQLRFENGDKHVITMVIKPNILGYNSTTVII